MASSREAQLRYESAVPIASVADELFAQWEDCVPYEDPEGHYTAPAFSLEEQQAIAGFHAVWDRVVGEKRQSFGSLQEFQATPQWQEIRDAAQTALFVFKKRGRLPED